MSVGLESAVQAAVASVDDPEYPGISIIELGLLETIELDDHGVVDIGLIPTFSGCPALAMIAEDVEAAVAAVQGVASVRARWLASPVWSIERVSVEARRVMAEQFTVAVQIGSEAPTCPRCGGETEERSMFGPSRCRAVNRCRNCSETVEVMRA